MTKPGLPSNPPIHLQSFTGSLSIKRFDFSKHSLRTVKRATDSIPDNYRDWLEKLFPSYVTFPFAQRHVDLWEWVWALRKGVRPRSFVAIWARGGAKSTSAELACVMAGTPHPDESEPRRRYVLYVSETQEQADDHVQNIASMLETSRVEEVYPQLAARSVGKFGNSKGWRRNRVRTASGLTIDAIGLDSAGRGAKLDEYRPDLLVFDDIDGELDTIATTEKKIKIITRKLIPAGSNDVAILAIQNLIIPDGVFSRLADGRADFMSDRIVSGPHPAIEGFAYEQREGRFVITGGTATWGGQSLDRCQEMIDDMGLSAFLSECQHDVTAPPGGIFSHLTYQHCAWDEVPWGSMIRTTVWVDPAVTDTDQSDSMGIQADGLAADGKIYRLWSWEQVTNPEDALRRAILKAFELKADTVGVETDQGGDTWKSVYRAACQMLIRDANYPEITHEAQLPKFKSARAGSGHGPKAHRASQMLVDYEHGKFVHVLGTHTTLERALFRFPVTKPLDLTDAAYWAWYDLRKGIRKVAGSHQG